MGALVVWHGTEAEASEMLAVLARNCVCEFDTSGARTSQCAAHEAFVTDQRWADGLVFARRTRACLLREEFRQ